MKTLNCRFQAVKKSEQDLKLNARLIPDLARLIITFL